ncbi:LCP family protein [Crocosphaera chwakensis]|uniref:Regulation of penicillin binding protein 5 production n=1 Tax=Crocosphaera chwakensis CCY0110 TaxID=391612 RepID=A3IQ92_9CHRO|nr:LCP family protein [Crocosphaera chwakensis]EAZ91432.1 regulation of penicillin binding protein 5 production [Crocosphaera chwakensis CCY0110]
MANSVNRVSNTSGFQQKSGSRKYKSPKYHNQMVGTNHLHKQGKNKGFRPLFRGIIWGMGFGCTAVVSATVGAAITLFSPLSENILPLTEKITNPWTTITETSSNETSTPLVDNTLLQYRLSRPINLLVLGIDRVLDTPPGSLGEFGGRSDTILLLRFDPTDNSVKMLSVPRDSRVNIPSVGYTKINDANIHGGPGLAARVLSKTLNDVPIDRYVRVTTDAFTELVDLVGGVEVFVPYPMQYEDKTQNLNIDLQPGRQILNGEQAEQFARFRKDSYGDIGRVQRQQILLKALRQRITNPTIIPRIPQAIGLVEKHIDTNLTWEEMLALVNFGRQLDRDQVQMVMLPGRFSQEQEFDNRSYWVMSETGRDQVMEQYFGITPQWQSSRHRSPNRVRIALQNATDDPGLANQVREYLAKQDIHNVYTIADAPQLLRETEIVVQQGDFEAANYLQTILGMGRVEASSTGDLDSQLTLRIGLDAKDLLIKDSFLKTSETTE